MRPCLFSLICLILSFLKGQFSFLFKAGRAAAKPAWKSFLLIWMTATLLHLPVPICDGDDIQALRAYQEELCWFTGSDCLAFLSWLDVDYIFLGCQIPSDVDNGPVDQIPQNSSNYQGVFPLFIKTCTQSNMEWSLLLVPCLILGHVELTSLAEILRPASGDEFHVYPLILDLRIPGKLRC